MHKTRSTHWREGVRGSLERQCSERCAGICQVVQRRKRHPQQKAQPEQRFNRGRGGELPVVKVFGETDEARGVTEPTREGLKG